MLFTIIYPLPLFDCVHMSLLLADVRESIWLNQHSNRMDNKIEGQLAMSLGAWRQLRWSTTSIRSLSHSVWSKEGPSVPFTSFFCTSLVRRSNPTYSALWVLTLNAPSSTGQEPVNQMRTGLADYLSPPSSEEVPQPAEIVLLMEHLNAFLVTVAQFQVWTGNDTVLSKVMMCVLQGWPKAVGDS